MISEQQLQHYRNASIDEIIERQAGITVPIQDAHDAVIQSLAPTHGFDYAEAEADTLTEKLTKVNEAITGYAHDSRFDDDYSPEDSDRDYEEMLQSRRDAGID